MIRSLIALFLSASVASAAYVTGNVHDIIGQYTATVTPTFIALPTPLLSGGSIVLDVNRSATLLNSGGDFIGYTVGGLYRIDFSNYKSVIVSTVIGDTSTNTLSSVSNAAVSLMLSIQVLATNINPADIVFRSSYPWTTNSDIGGFTNRNGVHVLNDDGIVRGEYITGTVSYAAAAGSTTTILDIDNFNTALDADATHVNIHGGYVLTTADDVEITDTVKGFIFKSSGGFRYRLKVDDGGNLSTELVP